jgi:6-phosphogluconolactonase
VLPFVGNRNRAAMDPLGRFALIGNGVFTIDASTGALTRQAAPGIDDNFGGPTVIDPSGRFAYSIEGFATGLATYSLDPVTGVPTRLTQPQPAGAAPQALVVDPQGRFVFVATDKTTGPADSIQAFTVDAGTGALTPLPAVPSGLEETRSIAIHPSGRWLIVTAESGNALFSVDTTTGVVTRRGTVDPASDPAVALFDPSGRFIYIGGESTRSVSIVAFDEATGTTRAAGEQISSGPFGLAVSAAPTSVRPGPLFAYSVASNDDLLISWRAGTDGVIARAGAPIVLPGTRVASLQVHPSQRFLYVAEQFGAPQGSDALVRSYSINAQTGALTLVSSLAAGRTVFSLALGPGGRFAYAVNPGGAASDPERGTVRVLAIDDQTGALSDAGAPIVVAGKRALRLRIEPRGRFAYVLNQTSNDISAFEIDASGELTPAGTFFASSGPWDIGFSPDGRFAYVWHGGDGNLVTYRIDASTGALSPVGVLAAGADSSAMALHPTRPFLYISDYRARSITGYRIDTADGQPVPTGGSVVGGVPPEFMQVDPSGRFLYATATSFSPKEWRIYRIDDASGALTDTGAAVPNESTTNGLAFTIGLR